MRRAQLLFLIGALLAGIGFAAQEHVAEPNANQRMVINWLESNLEADEVYIQNGPDGFDYVVRRDGRVHPPDISVIAAEGLKLDETEGVVYVIVVNRAGSLVIGAAKRFSPSSSVLVHGSAVNLRASWPYGASTWKTPSEPSRPVRFRSSASSSGFGIECTSYERGNTQGVRCVDSDGRVTGNECTSYGSGATFGVRCRDL